MVNTATPAMARPRVAPAGGLEPPHVVDVVPRHPTTELETGRLATWLLLGSEFMFFGVLFVALAALRPANHAAFAEGVKHMDLLRGTLGMVALLGSGLTMALAVRSGRLGSENGVAGYLVGTLVLGGVFLGMSSSQLDAHLMQGLLPGKYFSMANMPHGMAVFMSLVFAVTLVHMLHVLVGVALLVWLAISNERHQLLGARRVRLECVGLYWQFLGVVWVFAFPALYLVR